MGYHEGISFGWTFGILCLIVLVFSLLMQSMYGNLNLGINVRFDQQSTVDSLNSQLSICQSTLSKYQEISKAICECRCPTCDIAVYSGFVFGVIAVIIAQIFGKALFNFGRKYELKRKEKKEKDKK
jgi:hypothetical protein